MDTSTLIATVGGLLGICVSGFAVVKFWMHLSDRITEADAKAKAAETAAGNANIQTAALHLEIDRLKAEHVEHRVAVAKEYVSKETLDKLESRVIEAIQQLSQRIDRSLASTANH
jgi:hypothetical protein